MTSETYGRILRPIESVDQLGQAYRGKCSFLVARCAYYALNQSFDSFPAAFRSDHYTGIEDQSHAGGLSGSRWLSIAASTSLAKSSSSVTVEPCSRARRRDSESSRT